MKSVPDRSDRWLAVLYGAATFMVVALAANRLGVFRLAAPVDTPTGSVLFPNTFATVDHPFHVARASMLWNELAAGSVLRWVGQHQGGYPVEFYPLGEAWFEVAIRALALGSLSAEGAHTLAVAGLFLLPGVGFYALARVGRQSLAVGPLALALHVSLPGGWYDGGYTELVQWGLVTNVAGSVAAFLLLPALGRFLMTGRGVACALAAGLATAAIYANPRSLIGVIAVGAGTWLAVAAVGTISRILTVFRLASVAVLTALLTAPETMSLFRFGHLYAFVRYSGYDDLMAYVSRSLNSVTGIVFVLGALGAIVGLARLSPPFNPGSLERRSRPEAGSPTTSFHPHIAPGMAACSLVFYALLTLTVAFVPAVSSVLSQLEPTRLMPLQRLLTIYLAADIVCLVMHWAISSRVHGAGKWAETATVVLSALVVVALCFPATEVVPDPASPVIPSKGLYPVAMSAQQAQFDFQGAVRNADKAAAPGTALLIIGSALSWHQPLWAPLWTPRPLYYDNWLWSWRPDHAGTPGYRFEAGNHYPDPERTLERAYLDRHGIGAVIVTGPVRDTAARIPWLIEHRGGPYSVFVVDDPVTTLTFGGRDGENPHVGNGELMAEATVPAASAVARVYWHPRWSATSDGEAAAISLRSDGYQEIRFDQPVSALRLAYAVQPIDWIARMLAAIGVVGCAFASAGRQFAVSPLRRWYARRSVPGEQPSPVSK